MSSFDVLSEQGVRIAAQSSRLKPLAKVCHIAPGRVRRTSWPCRSVRVHASAASVSNYQPTSISRDGDIRSLRVGPQRDVDYPGSCADQATQGLRRLTLNSGYRVS